MVVELSTSFTAQEAQREYPDAEITMIDWARDFMKELRGKTPAQKRRALIDCTDEQLEFLSHLSALGKLARAIQKGPPK